MGEIQTQIGDAVGALKWFKRAHRIDPFNPLPYVNAGRVYQQLKQNTLGLNHLSLAAAADPNFAMTRVELAQHYLHLGRTEDALRYLDGALELARHVSEIKDVLTGRKVALLQLELKREGISS
jgi:tetratricopeptide (TPR) repeat protein